MTSVERIPWGSLPLELHVLSEWTSLAIDDLDQRRRQLAQQYITIGYPGRYQQQLDVAHSAGLSDFDLPPQAEWESILAPLRTDFQRQLASPYSFMSLSGHCWGIIWLRTCYSEGSDEAHRKLLDRLNWDQALELEELILDDAALYEYGDDWHRIFEVMPERLFEELLEGDAERRDAPEVLDAPIREEQRKLDFDKLVADTHAFKHATVRLHCRAVRKYLFVVDKVALDTGQVLVVFFDDCGRTVRQSRMEPEYGEMLAGAWANWSIDEMDEFSEAEIGPDYLPRGSCGPPYAT